jgi:hypothetical protein
MKNNKIHLETDTYVVNMSVQCSCLSAVIACHSQHVSTMQPCKWCDSLPQGHVYHLQYSRHCLYHLLNIRRLFALSAERTDGFYLRIWGFIRMQNFVCHICGRMETEGVWVGSWETHLGLTVKKVHLTGDNYIIWASWFIFVAKY